MLELVSRTGVTESKRKRRHRSSGGTDKKKRTQAGTPKFPIHPEGKPSTDADSQGGGSQGGDSQGADAPN